MRTQVGYFNMYSKGETSRTRRHVPSLILTCIDRRCIILDRQCMTFQRSGYGISKAEKLKGCLNFFNLVPGHWIKVGTAGCRQQRGTPRALVHFMLYLRRRLLKFLRLAEKLRFLRLAEVWSDGAMRRDYLSTNPSRCAHSCIRDEPRKLSTT